MAAVPRAAFLDPAIAERANEDAPLPIGEGQTMSQPLVVALMAQALALEPGHRVLEVGAGSGYAAAVMAHLAGEVHALEVRPALADLARRNLERAGFENVVVHLADGIGGWPPAAPYNAISVAAAAPRIPSALVDQLAAGGRLVMPVGGHRHQQLVRVRRGRNGGDTVEDLGVPVRFVPLVAAEPKPGVEPGSG